MIFGQGVSSATIGTLTYAANISPDMISVLTRWYSKVNESE